MNKKICTETSPLLQHSSPSNINKSKYKFKDYIHEFGTKHFVIYNLCTLGFVGILGFIVYLDIKREKYNKEKKKKYLSASH
jgi:nitrate reductase NapE component